MDFTDVHQRTQAPHVTAYSSPEPIWIEPAPPVAPMRSSAEREAAARARRKPQPRPEVRRQRREDLEPEAEPAAQRAMASKKTFTSEKLTWVNLLMADHRQEPIARLVGIALAQTINEDTKDTRTSDRVIADRLGTSTRTVLRARMALRDGGWITWEKPHPRAANRTELQLTDENTQYVEDRQTVARDRREFEDHQAGRRRTRPVIRHISL